MADFFRVQLGVVSRSEGHSAAKRSAYQSCGKVVDHEGKLFDFRRKAKEHVAAFVLTPETAPSWTRDAQRMWQRAAAAEKRTDAQEARIIDFSMPRVVPAELWEACIRYVYSPLTERGMILQIDIHDTVASDGGRNVNVHGLATLRPIDGDSFASRKDRSWNDLFRERNGRSIREQFAERLTSFCVRHDIRYEGDARSNAERDLPIPEPQLPKWNFEAFSRTGEKAEALAALHEHRRKRRIWETAKADEVEAMQELDRLRETAQRQRQRRIMPSDVRQQPKAGMDRRAAILRTWHKGNWIDAEDIAAIASVRYDHKRDHLWIDLNDGATLIDRGDAITLQGRITWVAAQETAAAAERHGWKSARVQGDQAYKDAVAVACMLRRIEVTNHALSTKARTEFSRLLEERSNSSTNPNGPTPEASSGHSSAEIYQAIAKRHAAQTELSSHVLPMVDASPAPMPAWRKSI